MYLGSQISTLFFLECFAILGFFITLRVKQQPKAKTKRQENFRKKYQKKAIQNMWMVIIVFSFVQLYFLILSITLFIQKQDCEYPANNVGWNVFLWIMTRTLSYCAWAYPLIYLFWPPGLTRALRKSCGCCKKKVPAHQRNM